MNNSSSIYTKSQSRLPLVTESGGKYSGLENSKSPELCQRVTTFFDYLNEQIGFPKTDLGRENQVFFNLLLQSA